jgi:hypothetical protein
VAFSNGNGMVKSYRIGQPNAAKSPNIKGETFNDYNQEEIHMNKVDFVICRVEGIV